MSICQHIDPSDEGDRECSCEEDFERACGTCGEREGSTYAKRCCTDDNMIEL